MALAVFARALGLVLIVGAGATMYWLTTSDRFLIDPPGVPIAGLSYTDEQQVREQAGLTGGSGPNVFRVHATAMADAIRALPSVESAEVWVALPDRVEITVHERQPLLAWQTTESAYLVDIAGAILSVAPPGGAFPVVDDRREASASLTVGERLDEVDLAAARLLLTTTPADLGSSSSALTLTIDDEDGFSLVSAAPAWRAVFGFYTANQLRPEDRVPRQRQCLASMLAGGEARLEVIYLAVAGETCGTYRDRPTPSARFYQNVGKPGA